jgi:subfamily B ATP-binding cassette protein MsbA
VDVVIPLGQKGVQSGVLADVERARRMLMLVFGAIIGLYLLRGAVSYSLNALIGWLGQRVVFDLRFQSYRHLQRLSLAYYDGRQPGKIMARQTTEIEVIQYALTSGLRRTFISDVATVFS